MSPLPEFHSPYPMLGFRSWKIKPVSGFLVGAWGHDWVAPFLLARCLTRRYAEDYASPHNPPYESCTCGIYATKTITSAYPNPVLGLVAMDDVIEGSNGYRGSRAWVLGFALDKRHGYAPSDEQNLRYRYPSVDICRSPESLLRVHDYFTNNPDKIPSYEEVANGHRTARAAHSPDDTPDWPPRFTRPESERSWQERTGLAQTQPWTYTWNGTSSGYSSTVSGNSISWTRGTTTFTLRADTET